LCASASADASAGNRGAQGGRGNHGS
jgi:hypothetical protein